MSILNVWNNRKKILEGIKNNLFKKEEIEKIASSRMEICNTCPFIDLNGDKCFVPGTQPCCSKCGCKLSWKVRSLASSCGDEENPRWTSMMTIDEENEIYEKLNYDPDA